MSKASSKGGISSALLEAVDELLGEIGSLPLEEKLSIIDRAIKLEALKLKVDDGTEGSAFDQSTGDDE